MFLLRTVILGVVIGLVVLTLVYALAPVHRWVQPLIAPAPIESIFLTTPTPVRADKKAGADTQSVVDTSSTPVPAALPTASAAGTEGRYAFLLLGFGGGNHDGAYLSDSIMVVIVDPAQKSLTLLSVPRDSWVPLAFDGTTTVYNKINTAYAFAKDPTLYPDRLARYSGDHGAGLFTSDTVSRLVGVPIQYYLGLDFQGFRDMIDAVGGVDVDVPASFAAQYPANDDPSVDASWKIVRFDQGLQHLNGERAIEYARAREVIDNSDEGSDFARSRRQRLIMQAFKTRLFEPGGLIHLPQLLGIAGQHVDTNYSIPDAAKLSQLVLGWKDVKLYQTALTTGNYLEDATGPDGTYLTLPNSPDHSWAQIRAFARQLTNDPAAGVAMASTTILVENDTGVTGVAGQVSDALIKLGYQVGDPISGPYRAQTQLADRSGGKAGPLVDRLSKDLGLVGLSAVDAVPADGPTNVLVLELGADEVGLSVAVPTDKLAPTSAVGVVMFGVWPYTPPAPTETPQLVERPFPTPLVATPTPARAASRPSPTAVRKDGPVVVPSLIGLSEAEAQQAIGAAGLMTAYVNYQTSADVADHRYFLSIAPGHVLSQSPRPGETVPRGTRVLIAVRK